MSILKKQIKVVLLVLVIVGLLAGCYRSPDERRISPEDSLKNYMVLVEDGEIEKSHEFMHGVFLESMIDENDKNLILGEAWADKIINLEGYKTYTNELKNLYSDLEYEVTDTHKREGSEQVEFTINLTMPDIDKFNQEVLKDVSKEYLVDMYYSDDEMTMLNVFDRMYDGFAEAIRDSKLGDESVTGHIIFTKGGKTDKVPDGEWIISAMEYELFNMIGNKKNI